jgi:phage tail tape-measure protein
LSGESTDAALAALAALSALTDEVALVALAWDCRGWGAGAGESADAALAALAVLVAEETLAWDCRGWGAGAGESADAALVTSFGAGAGAGAGPVTGTTAEEPVLPTGATLSRTTPDPPLPVDEVPLRATAASAGLTASARAVAEPVTAQRLRRESFIGIISCGIGAGRGAVRCCRHPRVPPLHERRRRAG